MSNPPEQRPTYGRPITVEIPVTWTPEQALVVYELLDELATRENLGIYDFQLQDLLREQLQGPGLDDSDDSSRPTQSEPHF